MRHAAIGLGVAILLFFAASANLSGFPPLWWDEGWTLTVARNWVERGHYGRFLAGEPAPPGLEAAFPVTALIALSFKLLGVGVWQGRLVGVICMVGGLAMMYSLALLLYNRKVAIGMLLVIFFMSPHPALHPFLLGRQVLAEMPMLFYLLSGYFFFLLGLRRSAWFFGAAILFWGISLNSKAQVVPFWFFSLLFPLLVALVHGRKRMAVLFGLTFLVSLLTSRLLLWVQQLLLAGHTIPAGPVQGIYQVTALVFGDFNRLFSLHLVLRLGLATLVGLCFAAGEFFLKLRRAASMTDEELVRLSIWCLTSSWFAWYTLFSVGFPRYLFPPFFMGSLFVAAMVDHLTDEFRFSSLRAGFNKLIKKRRFNQNISGLLLLTILIVITVPPTIRTLSQGYPLNMNNSVIVTAEFLNTQTPKDSLIETYESELHFFLKRRYHYPPDQVHIELNRRTFLGQAVPISYDPLRANPDYLVVGKQAQMWQLYYPVLKSGAFRLLHRIERYEVYERVR